MTMSPRQEMAADNTLSPLHGQQQTEYLGDVNVLVDQGHDGRFTLGAIAKSQGANGVGFNHDPVFVTPETVTSDPDAAVRNCAVANKWAVIGAQGKRWQRTPLHAIRTLYGQEHGGVEEADEQSYSDDDDAALEFSWGGREYAADEGFYDPNIAMVERTVAEIGGDPRHVSQLEPIVIKSQSSALTKVGITRYYLPGNWTIDVALIERKPRSHDQQTAYYSDRADLYGDNAPIETGAIHLNIWACPPDQGLDTLYFVPSDKPATEVIVADIEQDMAARETQSMRAITSGSKTYRTK